MDNTKRKILCVSEYFDPHWTGLSKSFFSLARSFVESGNDVSVLTLRYTLELPEVEEKYGLKIHRFPFLFQISRTQYSPQAITYFMRHVCTHDTVVINSPYSNILPIALLSKLFGKRLAIYHQGDLILARHSGSRIGNFVVERIFDFCTLLSMALADKISTYTSDYAKHSRVMKYFTKKCSAVIPKIRAVSAERASDALSEKLRRLKKDFILVGFAGRFVEEKGFDVLFRAIPDVVREIPNVKFTFAGETQVWYEDFFSYNRPLIEQQASSLEFLGLLRGGDLEEFYRSLSVFVLSSRSDCFALTQAEAALEGVPIVVSDIPGARMLVRETGFGVVASPPGDPNALSKAIVKAVRERESLREKRSNVSEFLKRYDAPEKCL